MTKMKNKSKLITIVFILALSLPLLLANSANAAYLYGYKAGDKYSFHTTGTYSIDTPAGKGGLSESNDLTITIVNVTENTNSHLVDINYTLVGGWGSNPVTKGTMEGDPTSFTSSSSLTPAAMFVTTDWDNRSTQWTNYINSQYANHTGYTYIVQSVNPCQWPVFCNH